MNPSLLLDFYKTGHADQYPKDTNKVVSNFTCRGVRIPGVTHTIFFGLQYYIRKYLDEFWEVNFFRSKDAPYHYHKILKKSLGPTCPSIDNLLLLHDLGYLPIQIRALAEGTRVPLRVPCYTIHNTHPDFFWLPNFLETQMSATIWPMITSATTADLFKKRFLIAAEQTGASKEFCDWQGHDFSMRGIFGIEGAIMSGMAHLTSFKGTDTVPSIDGIERYYYAPTDYMIGGSVPATEHAVMCAGIAVEGEEATIKRLITETYPTGIVSIVCDSFDFWNVVTNILPKLRDIILKRDGKVVIRPDSGDPCKIICGDPSANTPEERKGLIHCLYQTFGGTHNKAGFIELDSHIGAIYGDSINLDTQNRILNGLKEKNFASSNIVMGIGSFTYQYVTRDTYGCAIKATYIEVNGKPYNIYKAPKTDNGLKNSCKGLPFVTVGNNGNLVLQDQVSWEQFVSDSNQLKVVYECGQSFNPIGIDSIRELIEKTI